MQGRQIEILRAAIPYTEPRLRKPMQIVIQAEELHILMTMKARLICRPAIWTVSEMLRE